MIKQLDWDSDFFGFKTGKIELPLKNNLTDILKYAKSDQYKLLYLIANENDKNIEDISIKNDGLLIDKKITFNIDLPIYQGYEKQKNVQPYKYNYVTEEIKELAIESGIHSRYKIDNNFKPNLYKKMYEIWIERSIKKELADKVLVIENNEKIIGFITLSIRDNIGNIGLISVSEKERRKNIGKQLILAGFSYFQEKNIRNIQIITQERNKIACQFYEKCGFYKNKIENVFHFWL